MTIRKISAVAIATACLIAGAVRAAPSGSAIPDRITASDPKEARPDVEGALKAPAPGMFDQTVQIAPVTNDVVAANDVAVPVETTATTRCGLTVLTTSEKAVGDPCATTADVMASLNLTDKQIAYVNNHTALRNSALAH